MSASTGLGLLDVLILEAIEAAGAQHPGPYVKSQRALDLLHERTGIGPTQAYESLCDLARPYVAHLQLVDFHGNYGSPEFGPAAARYTECRLTGLGRATLAAERGHGGPLPIALVNGDLHLGRRCPPFDPRRTIEAIRAAAAGEPDATIVDLVGLPSFPSGCEVAGDRAAIAGGRPSEIVVSASMVDGIVQGRATVTITDLPPFTSAGRIAELVNGAVRRHGRALPGRELSPEDPVPPPVSDLNDVSHGSETRLQITGRSGTSHAELRRFLDRIEGIHQRVQTQLDDTLPALVRRFAASTSDLDRRLELIHQAIRSPDQAK